MQTEFWVNSWELEGTCTSFHRSDIHPYVIQYAPKEYLDGKRVLVPLCGKTNDMLWFARYADEVVGIELVEKPILQFFTQNNLPYRKFEDGRYVSGNITLLNRNMFELTVEDLGRIDLVYDRASLIAFPPDMRQEYIAKLHEVMPIGSQQLLNTLEYDPTIPEPPFSVSPEEVQRYYGECFRIDHVENPCRPEHRMISKFGLKYLIEHAFILTRVA
jgi:thiopurine S-methyltransferase